MTHAYTSNYTDENFNIVGFEDYYNFDVNAGKRDHWGNTKTSIGGNFPGKGFNVFYFGTVNDQLFHVRKILSSLQGNKVSLRLCRQVDALNHCSIANKIFLKPFMVIGKATMPFGCLRCTTQFVTLLAAPTPFVRAATCVLHATSFIPTFVPLHSPRSPPDHLLQGMAQLATHIAKHK